MRRLVLALVLALSGIRTAGADGVHAVGRVRPIEPGPAFSLALTSGYGYTGEVLADGDTHHRAFGAVAAAFRATPWLELGGQLTGRYDKHEGTASDDGLVGDPRLWITAGQPGARGGFGVRVGLWLPGAEAPSVKLDAATMDAAGVFTLVAGATTLTATAGYRLDRSTASVDAAMLTPGDRVGIGLSDADAVLVGLGLRHRTGPWQLLAEASGDLLVGDRAPDLLESPLRVGAGVRRVLDARITVEAMVEVSTSQRPDLAMMPPDVLVAIEPSAAIGVGLSYSFAAGQARTPTITRIDDAVPVDPLLPPPPPAPTTGTVRGTVVDAAGAPVPGATVTVGTATVQTGDDGTFVIPDVAAGEAELRIDRAGYQPDLRTITVGAGAEAAVEVALVRAKLPSQIRGLIRSFGGQGLAATVRIEPLGQEITAAADGTFTVDVPPGDYTVVITMPGYKTQRRPAKVEDEGVFVLNAELSKGRP